jgi:DUF1680 family protein
MKRLGAAFILTAFLAYASEAPAPSPVVDVPIALDHSLNSRLHPAPISAVQFTGGFWATRIRIITEHVLPTLRQQLDEHGLTGNFYRPSGNKPPLHRARPGSDAEVYEWIEAASWALGSPSTPLLVRQQLQSTIETLVLQIAAAQDESGYVDTSFIGDRTRPRFTDLLHSHEDSCLAHLLLAGIAYYRTTQNRSLLEVGQKFANWVANNFGPSARPLVVPHPELISALVELYRTVGDTRYLDLARYLLSGSERLHGREPEIRGLFSVKPFTSHSELEGVAVNALRTASGATDYFAESGDPSYKRTLDLLWNDLTSHRLSITGGVGLRAGTDSFADPYAIAESRLGSETPAAIANAWWSFRMLALTGDARYADVVERALYNEISAAISNAGGLSCGRGYTSTTADRVKAGYYESAYCPPDISSLVESVGSLSYATDVNGVYVNLFNDSVLNWRLEDGTKLRVVQTTNYPWDGAVTLTLTPAKPSQFSLHVRWPAWAPSARVFVNGTSASGDFEPGSYITVTRTWQPGDTVSLEFSEQPGWVRANPRDTALYSKAAVERGPLVFALEQSELPSTPISDVFLRVGGIAAAESRKDLYGGVMLLKYPGFVADKPLANQPLYSPWGSGPAAGRRAMQLVLLPYFVVGSRENESVRTWIPVMRPSELSGSTPSESSKKSSQ